MQAFKQTLYLFGIAILMTVTIAGCGAQQEATGTTGGSVADAGTASPVAGTEENKDADPAAATRVYKQQDGKEVTIPVHPQRVIAVEYLGDVLATGVKPIGSVRHLLDSLGVYPDQVQGIADIGDWSANNYEKIVTLNPDLIIAPVYASPEQIDMLSQIAPTVVPPYQGLDVFERLHGIADIVGKPDAAEAWIDEFGKQAQTVKEKLSAVKQEGETAAVFQLTSKRFMVYGARNVGHVIYNVLGFEPPEPVKQLIAADSNFNIADISQEVLPEYAADRIFVVATSNDPDGDKRLKELMDSAIWKGLPAVRNGRVYTLSDRWVHYNPLMLQWQLNDAVTMLNP